MKRILYILLVCLLPAVMLYSQQEEPVLTYVIDYKTENFCNSVMLYTDSDMTVDWGNGQKETLFPENNRITLHHEFPSGGAYTVKVFGDPVSVSGWELYDHTDILSITAGPGCKIESFEHCYGVSHLDISQATEVRSLRFGGSKLNSLDLSNNPNLEQIDLCGNPIAKDKVALLNMVESLPDRTGKEPGKLMIDMGDFPRHKAICKRKNWEINTASNGYNN